MARERFTKTAGSNFMPSVDDPTMALIGDGPPDDVRLPPELGGHVENVQDAFVGPCACGGDHEVQHLVLVTVRVAECPARGFLWYRGR